MKTAKTQKIKRKYTSGKPGNVLEADYFYFDTAPREHKDLAIVCGGYEKCAPDFDINRSNYPYYFIKYTVNGKGTLHVSGQNLFLRPGVLTGFAPGTPHHYRSDPFQPMEHIFITFLGEECPDLFQKSTMGEKHYILTDNPDETLNLMNKILLLGHEKIDHAQEICCCYLRILLLEQAAYLTKTKTNFPISKGTYLDCKRYIDTHFSSIKSPGEVAEKCGIDVRYLSVLFKRYCHISPSQYLQRLKLNKAANLLLTTDLAIKEVAFRVGFEDPHHFSKNFKELHGLSPVHYRENHMATPKH
ncbi:MAG: helix-turn-helix domain-containing protein [Planctomycetes bacterium]|nr:helix-turn-helix domain-containing protein [Planctomycetota bacterium]